MKICNYLPIILIVLLIIPELSCKKENAVVINATITLFGGSVMVNGKAVTAPGNPVVFRDRISTGKKSFCEIKINDRNILRLNHDTDLVFMISEKDNTLQLERGWLAGVTKQKFTTQGKFFISCPTVTAAVRGTSFCIEAENNNNTYFCVCNGKIGFMENGQTKGEEVESAHHSAMRFTKKPDGTTVIDKKVGLLYHKDKGIEDMAKEINVTVDWTKSDSE